MNFKFTNLFNNFPFLNQKDPWWVKIKTIDPKCTYYFGPFASNREAKHHQSGYIDDLAQEKAQGIAVEIERCQPKLLTIYEE